ncbi:DUF724 domain-containing protein 2-like isoform X1 [Solanum pennellii]|uniref:DUF724 domain-containing protein 2-like isoform X1 n=1 Tax=Solanum pennellii TaxID=28526 RepID=A0ABM1G9D0_SOLPN|nr:DUF724 domain-containing protein 2-like isoform X1 [Solanum pennellii]
MTTTKMLIEKVGLGTVNASASPAYKSPFTIGDEVEVSREEVGYSGALYEAVIVEPLKPAAPSPYPKSENKKRGFWVQYKHLLSDQGESVSKREFVRKQSLIRPAQPAAKWDQRRSFRVGDVVDAFHLAGWWTGVLVSIVWDDGGNNGCRFRVAFKDPDEEIEFSEHDLRFHLDWIGGNWVRPDPPHEKMSLQLGTPSPTLNHMIKGITSSKMKLETDTRTEEVRPPKKLRSRKHVVEALENQELPRPFVSGKAFTRKSRLLDFVENQDYFESVVDVGILSPCVQSLQHTVDEDANLSDFEFPIIEGSNERSTMDLSARRSLAVTQGVEKQVLESTLHDSVNEKNATNQAELSSRKTDGINTSAGASVAAVQPCSETTMPESEPRLVLPFKKNSALWREFESMEVFTKIPQNPHFSPLAQYEENKREEVALLKMTKYVFFVEKIPKLTVAELSSSALISEMLDTIKDLEEYGFDLIPIKCHLNDLMLNNDKQTQLRSKLQEEEGKLKKCYLEKAVANNEINKIALKIKDLEKQLMSAKTMIETVEHHIKVSGSLKGTICDDIRHAERDFEATLASVKQIFS